MKWVSIREFQKILKSQTRLYQDIYVRETLTDMILSKLTTEDSNNTLTDVLDGNGHTIHNIPTQLFDEISEGGILKNLTISQSNIESSALCQTNNGTIQNVKVVITQKTTESEVGGLVSVNNGVILDCNFEGDLKGKKIVGGISGINNGSIIDCVVQNSTIDNTEKSGGITGVNEGTVESCTNINSTVKGVEKVGGVAGSNKGCIKNGTVSNSIITAETIAGGVTGENSFNISDCIVTQSSIKWNKPRGVKRSTHTGYNFGGIVGYNSSILTDSSNKSEVIRCLFEDGVVKARKEVGGLIGTLNIGQITKCEIADGQVTGDRSVGGACGLQSGGLLKDIIIESDIEGKSHIGGISGWVNKPSVCESVVFSGSLPDNITECGKLFAKLYSPNISECYYAGEPKSAMLALYNTESLEGLHDSSGLSIKEVLSIMKL